MRIWRHLDLHLTLAISAVVGVLGIADVADAGILAGATLATLGIVAAGTLRVRLQLDGVTASTARLAAHAGEPSADRLLGASTSGSGVDLARAVDVRLVGVTLGRTLRNQLTGLRRCLERGGTVRVALISEDAVAEAARRSGVPADPEIFTHRLRSSVDLLRQLTAPGPPGRLEVRLLDFVPSFGLIAVDGDDRDGRIQVDVYSHRFGVPEPSLPLRADRDRDWYQHFLVEFEQLWSTGRPLPGRAGSAQQVIELAAAGGVQEGVELGRRELEDGAVALLLAVPDLDHAGAASDLHAPAAVRPTLPGLDPRADAHGV